MVLLLQIAAKVSQTYSEYTFHWSSENTFEILKVWVKILNDFCFRKYQTHMAKPKTPIIGKKSDFKVKFGTRGHWKYIHGVPFNAQGHFRVYGCTYDVSERVT